MKKWIRANAISHECTFCKCRRGRAIAADADELVAFVESCLAVEYEDASEMVAVEGGEYVGSWSFTRELLEDIGLEAVNDEALAYLSDNLPDNAWVPVDYYSLHPRDTLLYGWERFTEAIKHETRYLFFPPRKESDWKQHDELRPEEMLDELGHVVIAHELVKYLAKGKLLYRVRPHSPSESPTSITELASPPPTQVKRANRMSPAGISMLYVATDRKTAIAETRDGVREMGAGTLATFQLDCRARIVDFVRVPPSPGIFQPDYTREERGRLQFLNAFARTIALPVTGDEYEHIEYVPTQVVTEYFRHRFRADRKKVHGLRYRSAKEASGANVVLFLGHEDFDGGGNGSRPRLKLVNCERLVV